MLQKNWMELIKPNKMEINVVILNTTPRKTIDIKVANKGPKPLNIG